MCVAAAHPAALPIDIGDHGLRLGHEAGPPTAHQRRAAGVPDDEVIGAFIAYVGRGIGFVLAVHDVGAGEARDSGARGAILKASIFYLRWATRARVNAIRPPPRHKA